MSTPQEANRIKAENTQFASQPLPEPTAIKPLKVKVLVVDDEPDFCHAARILIDSSPSLACIGEAYSAAEALAQVRQRSPDVVLMDVVMYGGTGIECTRALTTLMPAVSVVVMTGVHRPQGVVEALMAGAKGYLLKPFTRPECHEALLHAYAGGLHLTPPVTRLFATYFQNFAAPKRIPTQLTKREEEVMGGFFQGLRDKEIAETLGVGTATIHSHTFNIFKKLKVSSRNGAIQKYMEKVLANVVRNNATAINAVFKRVE